MSSGKKQLKICMVAPYPPRKGGVTVQTELLVHNLEKSGFKVLKVDTNLQRVRVRGLGPLRLALQPWVVLFRLLANVPRCDVVQFQSASYWGFMPTLLGVPIARTFGKRSVITYQGGMGPVFMDRFSWLVKMPFRLATVATVCSVELQEAFKKRCVQTVLLRNLFDSELIKFRERTKIEPRIAWTRSMDEIYDPIAALKVFEIVRKQHPNVKLVMTSNGSMMQAVRDYADSQGLDGVSLPGRVPKEELASIVDEADLYLNTSRQDGLPTSLLEAAASGLPIVTTNAGGIASLFEHEKSAIICEIGDIEGLAGSILRLLANPEKAMEIGRAARDVAEQYTWPHVSKDLAKIYGLADK